MNDAASGEAPSASNPPDSKGQAATPVATSGSPAEISRAAASLPAATSPAAASPAAAARPLPWWHGGRPRTVAGAATALLLTLVVVVPWIAGRDERRATELRAELTRAVGRTRPFDARVIGGFAHGPMRDPAEATPGVPQRAEPAARAEAVRMQRWAEGRSSVTARAASGVASLFLGDAKGATKTLEAANLAAPNDARILTDLSAAFLVAADEQQDKALAERAFNAADRARWIDPAIDEAWYNRALALERLGMQADARAAWRRYLTRDAASAWATDARAHLKALEQPQR